jgi:hypothetical protein
VWLDADVAARVCSFPQALDVTDKLKLYSGLPSRTDTKIASEALVIGRLVTEDAGCGVVREHLGRVVHARVIGQRRARHKGTRLGERPYA